MGGKRCRTAAAPCVGMLCGFISLVLVERAPPMRVPLRYTTNHAVSRRIVSASRSQLRVRRRPNHTRVTRYSVHRYLLYSFSILRVPVSYAGRRAAGVPVAGAHRVHLFFTIILASCCTKA